MWTRQTTCQNLDRDRYSLRDPPTPKKTVSEKLGDTDSKIFYKKINDIEKEKILSEKKIERCKSFTQ